jgi:DNA-binding response OmpR family regulator
MTAFRLSPSGAGLYPRPVDRIVMLTDRSAHEVLPAGGLVLEAKAEPLSTASLDDALALEPELIVVDAAENPGQAHAVLRALSARQARPPALVVVERHELDRFRWEEVADEVLYPGAPEAEIRVRLAIVRRRHGVGGESRITLGPLTLDVDTYRVRVQGRALDLTFKEFELLRFLAERPGRVFTRPALMREVWGYDFYGGTRTVDVHVRRLRAKLGPAHEGLIETVRGVGYRTADV